MTAYYNENDQYAAAWLRNLIEENLIAPGDVDERSIVEIQAADLRGYVQCHFFAGIGGWSYALRLAGIPDDEPIWTGSCPCQPLSGAGQRKGDADERHLWPAFHCLIAKCRPATVFGEQVASKDGREWLAGVRADLEALGYAVGGADLCSASIGAPHIRQRLYWISRMGDAHEPRSQRRSEHVGEHADQWSAWSPSVSIRCLDGKARRVEPGIFPLVDGLPRGVVPSGDPGSPDYANATAEVRMMRLRGYGNAIHPALAAEFIRAAVEADPAALKPQRGRT